MSYLGRGLEQVDNISKLDNITFNGGTTYALTKDSAAFTPISSNAILVSIDGVIQQGNFSVSGSNIVFNFSVSGSSTCNFILHYGTGVAFTPADNSITKDKTNFVSNSSSSGVVSKGDGGSVDGSISLNCSQNSHHTKISSASHGAYSGNLNFVLPSSHGTNGQFMKTDGSGNLSFATVSSADNTPSFKATCSSGTTVGHDTNAQIAFQTEVWDTDNAFDNTTHYRFTVPSGEAGKYFFGASLELNMTSAVGSVRTQIWKNGTTFVRNNDGGNNYYHNVATYGVVDMAVGDYVEVRCYQNSGGIKTTQTGTADNYFFGYKLAGV